MIRRMLRRCGNAPSALSAEDQAVVDAFRAMLAAVRHPELWTPGCAQDVAVKVGPFIERARPRSGDDHGPDLIAVSLAHPDTPHAAAYLHGHNLGYTDKGWLRCETAAILDVWQPAYAMLTHAAADLPLPDDVGMAPAHYGVHVEARRSDGTCYTLLRLGPYTQVRHADRDAARLNAKVEGEADTATPGLAARAVAAPFDVSDRAAYNDPYETDAAVLLAAAVEGAGAATA
ncbi:hypothetical protein Scani_34400 [Streptomyces caniferus]|uniref:Uncharacterized protein n=1 Tax=Streptomyces caniferus TaxID=285557 RepID=A0A640S9H4_9ACTN|nr:hypothetical protein [Streptomyces caniferus]GFE07172.1 hypothetical protein Scani_34400 [Streptomyces caniferus]